ncbi:S8 family serine peptidase [Paracoccaceae bacterium GXU_MW_L88]
MAQLRPLLRHALDTLNSAAGGAADLGFSRQMDALATQLDVESGAGTLPVVMQIPQHPPAPGETWPEYKARVHAALEMANEALTGGGGEPLYLANAIAAKLGPEQIAAMAETEMIASIELDRLAKVVDMDDAVIDVGVEPFRQEVGPYRGKGVRVAVLDSGIDAEQPFLNVAEAVSTCGEPVELPGSHGTHCAGSVASQDAVFPGIAPDCTLLNVKVLRENGSGTSTFITKGVDAALDLEADILSMSLGFNHLPIWSRGGHGWSCPDGRCELCTAIDNAVFFGKTVIVAAGNEHNRAEALRQAGYGNEFDTELGCPGQARGAITVGALTKRTFLPADFTSHGPASYGETKPNIAGPGVNVTSTIPVPRDLSGNPVPDANRSQLFERFSGTSMATPIVAGTAALIFEHHRETGLPTDPEAIRAALLNQAVTEMEESATIVGAGRVDLANFGRAPLVG